MNDLEQPRKPSRLPVPQRSLDEVAAEAIAYGRNARSAATRRGYAFDLVDYEAWCNSRGLAAVPATVSTVGLYLADRAAILKYATLRRRLAAISVAHKLAGEHLDRRHPAIADVLQGIARAKGTRPTKKRALVLADLRNVIRRIPVDLAGLRDRAILLLGFAGALRVSELVAVDLEHLQFSSRGAVLLIPSSKTDQVGAGEQLAIPRGKTALCPIGAIERWVEAARIDGGPVFRSIRFGHHTIGGRLTSRSVQRLVKAHVAIAGFNPAIFSSHSMRSGFLTTAAAGGADLVFIMRHSRHRDVKTAQGYVQDGKLFDNPALKAVRL